MAKKKAKAGSKRVKATKKRVTRKKTLARAAKKAIRKAGKKATPKKAARKLTKKVARKVVKQVARKSVKKIVAKAAKKAPVKAGARPKPATKPKLPRRTKQAMPPATRVTPATVVDVEPRMPAPRTPVAEPPRPSAPAGGPPLDAEIVSAGPAAPVSRMPAIGDLAPDFQLPDETGQVHSLALYHGKKVVLYFYPKDDTPGCTLEACGFRDRLGQFTDHNAVVLGVSADPVESHQRFAQKYSLTFPILSDADHKVAERYGVWVEKTFGGQMSMGIARTTFIIDAGGRIEHVFRNVHAEGHEQEVLEHLAL